MTTNDREHKSSYLRARVHKFLQAFRCSGADWSDKFKIIQFGELRRDAGPQKRTVILRRGNGGPLLLKVLFVHRWTEEGSLSVPFHASALLRGIEPGERYELDITIEPPWPNANYIGIVRLETGVPEQPTADIKFMIMSVSPRRVAPEEEEGLPVPRERSTLHDVLWRFAWSPEAPPGRIIAVRTNRAEVEAFIEERDGQQIVVARIPPELPLPKCTEFYHVRVLTDDPSAPELQLPITFAPEAGSSRPSSPPKADRPRQAFRLHPFALSGQ